MLKTKKLTARLLQPRQKRVPAGSKKPPSKTKKFTGSGNVFRDLGLADAEQLEMKFQLALQVIQLIKFQKWSRKKASKILGIDQIKLLQLFNVRLEVFSADDFFNHLNALGKDIEIVIKQKLRSRKSGKIRVITK